MTNIRIDWRLIAVGVVGAIFIPPLVRDSWQGEELDIEKLLILASSLSPYLKTKDGSDPDNNTDGGTE